MGISNAKSLAAGMKVSGKSVLPPLAKAAIYKTFLGESGCIVKNSLLAKANFTIAPAVRVRLLTSLLNASNAKKSEISLE